MKDYTWLNWTLLLGSFAVMIGIGIITSLRLKKGNGEEGFLLAGRSLGPFVGAGTIVATGFSGWGFMGSPGVAYEFGTVEVLGNFFFAPAMVIAVLYFAKFLRKRAESLGSCTIPEYVAQVHGTTERSTRLLKGVAAVISIVLLMVFMVGQIKAVGLLASSWLGISLTQGSILIVSVIVIYTMMGGLTAVAWTDTLMTVGMVVAAILIMMNVFNEISLMDLITRLNEIDPALANPETARPYGESKGSVFLVLPYAFLFTAVVPYMAVRFLAFKSTTKMTHVAAYLAPMAVILSLVPIVGLYVRVTHPEVLEHADSAMPTFLTHYLSPGLAAMVTLFIMFMMMSTATSLLHSVSSAVSHDLRTALVPRTRMNANGVLWINRLGICTLGATALILMLFAPPFMLSWLGILGLGSLLAAMIGPVFISTFFQGTVAGALCAMVVGLFTSGYLLLATDIGWVEGPLIGCALSSFIYITVSKMTRPQANLNTMSQYARS